MNLDEFLGMLEVELPRGALERVPLEAGTRVKKTNSQVGDAHQNGARATVVARMYAPGHVLHGYMVIWDDMPGVPIFIAAVRVEPLTS